MSELAGRKAFVVEDEAGVALLIEDMLSELGCEVVASAAHLDQACAVAADVDCDFAILDINLNGRQVFPAAAILKQRAIPFLFSSGYGAAILPPEFQGQPTLAKPFMIEDLQQRLLALLSA